MDKKLQANREAAEDVYYGQVVTSWARWSVVAAGLVLALWTASTMGMMVVGTVPVVALMAVNFYLHGRYLAGKPANRALLTVASVLDLTAVTLMVALWSGHRGLASPFFIMYYPVVLAFAFVMPPRIALPLTVAALATYALTCLSIGVPVPAADGAVDYKSILSLTTPTKALVARMITLGAMGGLGAYYWRIQRERRRASMEASSATFMPGMGS